MAIQVNGTTVIDNSRQLTNIASADAATVAALGNSGVGGSTTNLGETSLSGTPTSFDVSLDSGYDKHIIHMVGLSANDYSAGLAMRMSNSSGTMLSNGHNWQVNVNNYNDYGVNNSAIKIIGNQVYQFTGYESLFVEIVNARDSSRKTMAQFRLHTESGYNSIGAWVMSTAEVNSTLRFQNWQSGSYTLKFGSGAYYKKYAVK